MTKQNAAKNDQAGGTGGFGSVFNENPPPPASSADFQTNFGGENTAMSDIFKGNSPGADDKKKKIIMMAAAGAALAVCAGALLFLTEGPSDDESSAPPAVTAEAPTKPAVTAPTNTQDDEGEDEITDDAAVSAATESEDAPVAATAAGSSNFQYNEKSGGPIVSAKSGSVVEVSTREDFGILYVAGTAKDGKFRIPNPPPGNVYWREQGAPSFNKIVVTPAAPLNISFAAPAKLTAKADLSWSAQGPAAFYRVELAADGKFDNVTTVFATSKTSMKLGDVAPGKYYIRLAGFNTASGRWEYSKASSVDVN